jgi:hypothetical protein
MAINKGVRASEEDLFSVSHVPHHHMPTTAPHTRAATTTVHDQEEVRLIEEETGAETMDSITIPARRESL